MKDHKKEKSKPSGGGMPYFERGHWEQKLDEPSMAGGRYASEMNTAAEYKNSVDKLANYVKSHRAEH